MKDRKYIENLFFNVMDASNTAIVKAEKRAVEYALDKDGKLEKNEYGELIRYADKIIRNYVVRVLERSKLPIGLISEDVKGIEKFNCNIPEYIISLDEQDGFGVALENNLDLTKARYGTMAAIFKGDNPKWKDALIGGITEHSPNLRIIYGSNFEKASYVMEFFPQLKKKQIKTSGKKNLDDKVRILSDTWFNVINTLFDIPFNEFKVKDVGGSEAGYVDVALGAADALGECTRKDNQEPAISYLMIKNAGGAMYSFKLKDYFNASDFAGIELVEVKDWNYLKSAEMAKMGRAPILTTATPELAQAMVGHINKFNDWKGSVMKGIVKLKDFK